MFTEAELKVLKKRNVVIDNVKMDLEFKSLLLENKKIKNVTITNSQIVLGEKTAILGNATITNCDIWYSNLDIMSSKIEDVKIFNSNLFSIKKSELNTAKFIGGLQDIQQSHIISFEFGNGSILNPRPGIIDFFGYENDFEFFRKNIELFPYSLYETELLSLVTMGTRDGNTHDQ